jgi:thiol-disulfide isomerase/thioredoxin
MKKIIGLLFCLQALTVASQNSNISGTAIGHPNELIRVIIYEDQFSRLDRTIATTRTDVWGNFFMTVSIHEPTYAFLTLGLKRGSFHLEPENSYHFQIFDDTIKGSVFDQLPLQFNINSEMDSLNLLIGQFNYNFNVFLYENQREIMRAKDKSFVMDFVREIKSEFISDQSTTNPYLKQYIDYSLASLEWLSESKSDSAILMDYFVNRKVLRENIAYTDLFRDYFKEYFKIQKFFYYDELISKINLGNLHGVDSLLKRNKILDLNDELRELSLITLLAANYHNPDIYKQRLYELLKQIELSTVYAGNKSAAENYWKKLTHLQYGSKAPPIRLFNEYQDIVKLADFNGQFVLLDFIISGCAPCLFDLKKLEEIQSSLKSKLTVILVVTDESIDTIKTQFDEVPEDFLLLHLNQNILTLEEYQIKTFPSYVLINPDATIAMAPAPSPSENLEVFIKGFMSRFENKR